MRERSGYCSSVVLTDINSMTAMHSIKPVTRLVTKPSLRSLLAAAFLTEPGDRVIAPVGENSYSTLFSLISPALAVLRVAAEIESEPDEVLNWYRTTRIDELGHLTAAELVAMGRSETVIGFLSSIRDGQRD